MVLRQNPTRVTPQIPTLRDVLLKAQALHELVPQIGDGAQ
jgi:hypothetical protein